MTSLVVNAIPLLGERSGIGRYTWEIASRLDPAVFSTACFYGGYTGALSDVTTIGNDAPSSLRWLERLKSLVRRHAAIKRVAKSLMALAARLRSREYDLYFEPNFILQPGLKARHRVITVHDFSCLRYPQWHPQERVRYFEAHLRDSLAQADRIITVSEAIRREAIEDFGISPERVVAIHNGVDVSRYCPQTPEALRAARLRWNLPEHFVLFVGTLEPRKNLDTLLIAYETLPAAVRARYPLVIAGGKGWGTLPERFQCEEANIIRLGFVPESELPALYGAASLLAYPSWYEGFGLPVLEAMACGCPVVTSTDPALMEVSGDAALCVPPEDSQSLGKALLMMLEDAEFRTRCIREGLHRAASFTWDASASKHAALFQDVCKG